MAAYTSSPLPIWGFLLEARARDTFASYRKWMGLAPFPLETAMPAGGQPGPGTVGSAIPAKHLVELAVLSAQSGTRQTARCRFLKSDGTSRCEVEGPGCRAKSCKSNYARMGRPLIPHLSAEIRSGRIVATALGLTPHPIDEYWGEESRSKGGPSRSSHLDRDGHLKWSR